jgi:mannan endo-1,6-alpha-mannosidase
MAASTKVAPWLYDSIKPYLAASAAAAALSCTGGDDGTTCGTRWWNNGVWDGATGVGQQMSALEVIQSNLIDKVRSWLTKQDNPVLILPLGSGTCV